MNNGNLDRSLEASNSEFTASVSGRPRSSGPWPSFLLRWFVVMAGRGVRATHVADLRSPLSTDPKPADMGPKSGPRSRHPGPQSWPSVGLMAPTAAPASRNATASPVWRKAPRRDSDSMWKGRSLRAWVTRAFAAGSAGHRRRAVCWRADSGQQAPACRSQCILLQSLPRTHLSAARAVGWHLLQCSRIVEWRTDGGVSPIDDRSAELQAPRSLRTQWHVSAQ